MLGFLCPSCLEHFASAEEVQLHYEEHHSDQGEHVTQDQGEGFLCPVCKISLASPEALQSHYLAEHSQEDPGSDSSHTRNGDITGVEIQELRRKLELLQSQLRGSEERSSLLSTKVFNSEQKVAQFSMQLEIVKAEKVAQFNMQLEIVKAEKEGLEAQAAELVRENATLRVKVDECEQQQKVTDQLLHTLTRQLDDKSTYAKNLEIQLAECQEAVEVLVLKQELTTAQALINKMTQDRNKDKEDLDKEHESFKVQQHVLQSSVSEREAAVQDMKTSIASLEIDLMQEKYKREKLQEQLSQLTQSDEDKQASLAKLQEEVSQSDEEKRNLQNILNTTQTKLQEAQAELVRRQSRLDQSTKSVEEYLLKISHLQTAQDEKDENMRLAQEKEMKATETVKDLKIELEKVMIAVDDNSRELEDLKTVMADRKSTSLLVILQKEQQISDLSFKVDKLQTDLEVKSSEMTDLQNQLSDSNIILENERLHCDELKAQMMEQDVTLEEEARKLLQLEDQIKDLENKILFMSDEKQRLENEKQNLVAKIDTGEGASELIHQMQQENSSLQEHLSSLESTFQGQVSEHFNKEEALHKQIREVRGQLQESESKMSKLEAALDEQCTKVKTVQQKLVEMESDLKVQTELLLTCEATKTILKADLENEIKKANISLEKANSDLSGTKSQLDQANKDLAANKEKIVQLGSEASDQKEKIVQLRSEVSEQKEKIVQLRSEVSEQKEKIVQLGSEVSEQKEKIVQLGSEVSEQKEKLFSANHKISSLDVELKEKSSRLAQAEVEKRDLELTLDANKQILIDSKEKLIKAEVEKRDMKLTLDANKQILIDSKGKLIKAELDLEVERRSKVTEKGEFATQLEMLTHGRTSLQQKYDEMTSHLAEMERKHLEKCKQLDVALQDLTATQAEFKKIEEMFLTTKENSDDQLVYLTVEFDKEKSKANEIKEELIKQVHSLTEERKHLNQEKMAFGEQVMNLSETLQQNISHSDSWNRHMQREQLTLQAEVDSLQKELLEASTSTDEHKKEASKFKHMLEMEQEEHRQTLESMKASKEVLLQQKLEIETDLIQLQRQTRHWSEKLAKVQHEAHEVQTALRQDNSALLDKLTTETSALEAMQKLKEEIEAEFDTQCTFLSENLTTVRTDLTFAEGNLEELTRINEQLRGERLELEIKLERCNDERRVLVERCIASERECEKLREAVSEQKYRLEDIQGALHELGRENQTLQITTTKVQGRKWTDDSNVTECTSCGKIFSVVVRKHHCRHCGHIFCNECSSKTTQTPMKRKVARVCDPCYRELSVQKL